jgi:hypothetical protein
MKWRSLEESAAGADLRPLGEIFAERKAMIEKYVPAETREAYARVVAELKQERRAEGILAVGSNAPGFALDDHNGKVVSSAQLLQKGRLVICFIRGRWCPFCVGQLEAMSVVAERIGEAGAALVFISHKR